MLPQILASTALPLFEKNAIEKNELEETELDRSETDKSKFLAEPSSEPRAFPHRRWPVHSSSPMSDLQSRDWELRIFGAVFDPLSIRLRDLPSLPGAEAFSDVGVTSYKQGGRRWQGIDVRSLLKLAGVQSRADWLVVHSEGGYSREISLDHILDSPAVLAYQADGRPLSKSEGGPLRMVLPHLSPWLSSKWVRGLELRIHPVD